MITKPMLAPNEVVSSTDALPFPLIASPKLDGIRCLMVGGKVLSRSFKPIQNHFIRKALTKILPEGADGEIIVGKNFQEVSSGVMSHDGEPDFTFWMFDLAPKGANAPGYTKRIAAMAAWEKANPKATRVVVVPTVTVHNTAELVAFEEQCLADGFEGAMVRAPDSGYKCGRATLKQGLIFKVKRFVDSEAEVVGFEEQMQNTNAATKDAFGRTKRSSAKAGKVGKGTLGKFLARDVHGRFPGETLKIGSGKGLTAELRQDIWDHRNLYIGEIIKYKYQEHGVKDKPRIPIWLGFRPIDDLGGE